MTFRVVSGVTYGKSWAGRRWEESAHAEDPADVLERLLLERKVFRFLPPAQRKNVPGTQAEGNGKEREA